MTSLKLHAGWNFSRSCFLPFLGLYASIISIIWPTESAMAKESRAPSGLLFVAAENGRTEEAAELLKRGARVNARDKDGATALMHAAAKGHDGVVELLLSTRARVNMRSKMGATALDPGCLLWA